MVSRLSGAGARLAPLLAQRARSMATKRPLSTSPPPPSVKRVHHNDSPSAAAQGPTMPQLATKAPSPVAHNGTQDGRLEGARSVQAPAAPAEPSTFTLKTPSSSAATKPTTFQKPACIATFSYDESRNIHHDNRSLGIYHDPPPPRWDQSANRGRGAMRGPNLNYGFERWQQRDDIDEHLDGLLWSLQHKASAASSSPSTSQAGASAAEADRDRARATVITWRGLVTKLCNAVFAGSAQDAWELNVMQVGNTLYIEERHSSQQQRQESASQGKLRNLMYQGYCFEAYCMSPITQPPSSTSLAGSSARAVQHPPGWAGDVNNNVQWCAVCKTTLGSHRLLIGGEVDGIKTKARSKFASEEAMLHATHFDSDDFIEVKTSAALRKPVDVERFEGAKMLRFYFQSFLLGVPTIVVGFRDWDGYLVDVQYLNTLQLPRTVRTRHPHLDAGRGLAFADKVLSWIRSKMSEHHQDVLDEPPPLEEAEKGYPVYRVSFTPFGSRATAGQPSQELGGNVMMRRLADAEILQEIKGGTESGRVGFLLSTFYTFARDKLLQAK